MSRVKEINRAVKAYDSELFAVCNKPPRIDVYRQHRDKLSPPHLIFSLTEDWTVQSKPIEWGIEPVIARLKAMDLWQNGVTLDTLIDEHEKAEESKRRAFRNDVESFLYDFRSSFKKATDGVNTALIKNSYRKENSHGNHQS